ncbi:MAG TPA: hypothetical protein VM488_03180 [Pseudobacter sp.]|nr:hypothetical protein [Pseudobacter sp.]
MKQLLLFICICVLLHNAMAQVPRRFNYQAVIRNTTGAIVAGQPVGIRFSIRDLTATGNILYRETQQANTNVYGLVNLQVGAGTLVTGDLGAINWGTGKKFLQVESDLSGGSNFTELATVELASVPFSLHAQRADGFTGLLNGDITGPQSATQLANGVVTTAKLADNSVDANKIAMKTIVDSRIADGQVVKSLNGIKDFVQLVGAGNVNLVNSGNNIIIEVPNGGDISGVLAGNGLTGGAAAGEAILAVNFGGNGNNSQVARSDHNHINQNWQVNGGAGLSIDATANAYRGLQAVTASEIFDAAALHGIASAENGNGVGVFGWTASNLPSGAGVFGQATGTGNAKGVWGAALGNNYAGWFDGKVHVNGTLSKAAGSFRIDHPLDPMNKYLSHSFVESPDMMNVYNGNIVLDGNGEAVVLLPDWFSALNKDYRYQLSAIGKPSPGVYVADEIRGNRFRIAGGTPGGKISWQVTGIRNDTYAREHRIQVEEWKSPSERNTISTNNKKSPGSGNNTGERVRSSQQ